MMSLKNVIIYLELTLIELKCSSRGLKQLLIVHISHIKGMRDTQAFYVMIRLTCTVANLHCTSHTRLLDTCNCFLT